MITLNKLRAIARAKFSNKNNLGDWYQKRLDICSDCPFNSKNKKDLTIKESAIVAANLGKDSCLACGCEIAAKASVRDESCGLTRLKQVPLWKALPEIEKLGFAGLDIQNLSSNMIKLTEAGEELILDYGEILKGAPSMFEISLKDSKNPITRLQVESGCSCTVPTPKLIGDTHYVSIEYNTNIKGQFRRYVTFRLTKGDTSQTFKAKIIGTVI